MARLGVILELERLNSVLKDIRECQKAPLARLDTANVLHSSIAVAATENVVEEIMLVSFVLGMSYASCVAQLTESKRGSRGIL